MSRKLELPAGGQDLDVELRWSDVDRLGHVNNAKIITLLEEARIRWAGQHERGGRFAHGQVVASLSIDYFTPVYYESGFSIRVGIVRIGTKSFTVRQFGVQNGEVVFAADVVLVPLEADGVSARAMDAVEREWLESQQFEAR